MIRDCRSAIDPNTAFFQPCWHPEEKELLGRVEELFVVSVVVIVVRHCPL